MKKLKRFNRISSDRELTPGTTLWLSATKPRDAARQRTSDEENSIPFFPGGGYPRSLANSQQVSGAACQPYAVWIGELMYVALAPYRP